MSNKRNIIITGTAALLSIAFILSFNWGMKVFTDAHNKNKGKSQQSLSDLERFASSDLSSQNTVSQNSKITIKIEYGKSGDIDTKEAATSDFAGKSKKDLENEGYIVESMTTSMVSLYKKIDSYAPNKYVLGVKDDCYAIYKTDDKGNMVIEDENTDISDIRVHTKTDYDSLIKGSKIYQFDNKEDAEEKLGELSS